MTITSHIQLLPPHLYNQIAAGEVIERPAAVVKELLENSIDAGATAIDIYIEKGGMQTIKVIDNGDGIVKEELPLAITTHATSKITSTDDLSCIKSLGFRGEALASMASISRFTLSSRTPQVEQGWCIEASNTDELLLQPVAQAVGTTVIVRDLFFNIPARRKFLRTEKTEYLHIETVFKRLALYYQHIALRLYHNTKLVWQLPAIKTDAIAQQRIARILGKRFVEKMQAITLQHDNLSITGWYAMDYTKVAKEGQYFYVNGRYVKDKLVNHAIRQFFEQHTVAATDKYAGYVLFLQLPARNVDVNVHPTKYEVRFQDGRRIHDFIYSALKKTLLTSSPQAGSSTFTNYQDRSLFEIPTHSAYQILTQADPLLSVQEEKVAYSAQAVVLEKEKAVKNKDNHQHLAILGQYISLLYQDYLLFENNTELTIVSSIVCQQLLCQYQWQALLVQKKIRRRPLLLPEKVTFLAQEYDHILQKQTWIETLGIVFSFLGKEQLLIREVPAIFPSMDFSLLIDKIINTDNTNIEERTAQDLEHYLGELVGSIKEAVTEEQIPHLLQQLATIPETLLQRIKKQGYQVSKQDLCRKKQ